MDILSTLKSEASKLQQNLDTINAAMKMLGGKDSVTRGKKRHLSGGVRARIAKAQRARWARIKKAA
jgi:ABC-type dipeptide/oligopeptide/nickel transport system ATPase subunit